MKCLFERQGHLSSKERLRHFSLEKKWFLLMWLPFNVQNYRSGGSKGDGARFFAVAPHDRTRGNGYKQKHRRFILKVRKLFLVRGMEAWHRLPREVLGSPSLEIFKSHLNIVLGNSLYVALLQQES